MMVCFFDSSQIASGKGLSRVPGPLQKLGPVIEPGEFDGRMVASFASSLVPLEDGTLRLYYTRSSPESGGSWGIAVAESPDGLKWVRPCLGQTHYMGKETNQLLIDGLPSGRARESHCQPQVFRLAERKWLMFFWIHGPLFRYVRALSEDGLHWRVEDLDRAVVYHPSEFRPHAFEIGLDPLELAGKPPFESFSPEELLKKKSLRSNDATYVFYDDKSGQFTMYSVWLMSNPEGTQSHIPYDNAPLALRTIHQRTSSDGVHWSDPRLIIAPDKDDPDDQQFYYLSVHWQDGWHIGMLGHYRVAAQTMDIELCFSLDGIHWQRPLRQPWLLRGPQNYDSKMVYAPNRLVDQDDHWLMLYSGVPDMVIKAGVCDGPTKKPDF